MTWPGIEPRSLGPLADTLTIMPMSEFAQLFGFKYFKQFIWLQVTNDNNIYMK